MNKKVIVLRINCYRDYDFIAEHNKIVDKQGGVWLLKIGRKIPERRLEDLIETSGILVLKADKRHGGVYFETKLFEYYYGDPSESMYHPDYYDELINVLSYTRDVSVNGTWLLIGKISKMEEERIRRLTLEKTGEPICKLMDKCSTACMYANLIAEED